MNRSFIASAVSAMPFMGKNFVRASYMAGHKATRQGNPEKALALAESIDHFADRHKPTL